MYPCRGSARPRAGLAARNVSGPVPVLTSPRCAPVRPLRQAWQRHLEHTNIVFSFAMSFHQEQVKLRDAHRHVKDHVMYRADFCPSQALTCSFIFLSIGKPRWCLPEQSLARASSRTHSSSPPSSYCQVRDSPLPWNRGDTPVWKCFSNSWGDIRTNASSSAST